MKSWAKGIVPTRMLNVLSHMRHARLLGYFARESYSQEGEDLILERFLGDQPTGFYVDVGAHHPQRFSNTYRLYRRGWRGINIDASPGSMSIFRRVRPRDVNIEAAVAAVIGESTFYVFNEPALNTFDSNLAMERVGEKYWIVKEVGIVGESLVNLLDNHVPQGLHIDLLTIDVEGLDYQVLQSNNWDRYSPDFVLVECLKSAALEDAIADPIAQFLFARKYAIVAKTMNTVLFKLKEIHLHSSGPVGSGELVSLDR